MNEIAMDSKQQNPKKIQKNKKNKTKNFFSFSYTSSSFHYKGFSANRHMKNLTIKEETWAEYLREVEEAEDLEI